MKRGTRKKQRPGVAVARALLVVTLALVVIWQLGHSFVPRNGEPSGTTDEARAYITTSDVNLRSGPGTSHDVLSVLPFKTTLSVTGDAQQGFAPVIVDGRQAWVAAEYIAPKGSVLAVTERVPAGIPTQEPAAVPTEPPEVVPTEAPTEVPAPEMQVAEVTVEQPVVAEVEVDTPMVAETLTVEEPAPVVEAPTTSETVVVPQPTSDAPSGEQWIEIDRTQATVTLHDGDRVAGVYDALLGRDPSTDGYYSTAVGTHYVFSMERALTETPFAPGVYLTDWVGFDPERSNGIHSPVRDAQGNVVVTGGTVTMGCVRVGPDQARAVFDFAYIGMRVEVHD